MKKTNSKETKYARDSAAAYAAIREGRAYEVETASGIRFCVFEGGRKRPV